VRYVNDIYVIAFDTRHRVLRPLQASFYRRSVFSSWSRKFKCLHCTRAFTVPVLCLFCWPSYELFSD